MFFVRNLILILFFFNTYNAAAVYNMGNGSGTTKVRGIEFADHPNYNSAGSSADESCQNNTTTIASVTELSKAKEPEENIELTEAEWKLHLKHRPMAFRIRKCKKKLPVPYRHGDMARIHTLHRRITEKNQNTIPRISKLRELVIALTATRPKLGAGEREGGSTSQLMFTVKSGISLGMGVYLVDVFLGTPSKHFPLILDTGSDLSWIQCLPCHDCFPHQGMPYNPEDSLSFRNVSCSNPLCKLVSSPDPSQQCKSENQTCEYFYRYGDGSNTTGDFVLETFTVNLITSRGESEFLQMENFMFGCGHWNRGHFNGAAGLLGLGRGPLSFSSQLQPLHGHGFSYCLVAQSSSASSKLILGEDKSLMTHPNLNFTSFVAGNKNIDETFYHVQIQAIMVGGEILDIPAEIWSVPPEGTGGTIIDSGATLSFFVGPAYRIIKEAFQKKVKNYPAANNIQKLNTCYNVSGAKKVRIPEFSILFGDGAVWNFPVENYFVQMDPKEIKCLAMSETPSGFPFSILGNHLQQNFHIFYDTRKSRLGFVPKKCGEL